MKIEMISENQIRCTLTREDLEDHQVRLTELAYGTEKAKRLFQEMMQQAYAQFGFQADNTPLMIEAIPVNKDSIVLLITKVEDPEELDTRFSKFSPFKHGKDTSSPQFNGADDILDFIKRLRQNTGTGNSAEGGSSRHFGREKLPGASLDNGTPGAGSMRDASFAGSSSIEASSTGSSSTGSSSIEASSINTSSTDGFIRSGSSDGHSKEEASREISSKDGTFKDGASKDGTSKDGTSKDGVFKDGSFFDNFFSRRNNSKSSNPRRDSQEDSTLGNLALEDRVPQETVSQPQAGQGSDTPHGYVPRRDNLSSEGTARNTAGKKPNTKDPGMQGSAYEDLQLVREYRFHHLGDVMDASMGIRCLYDGDNTLYKDRTDGTYQLIIHQSSTSPENFNKICNILSEYGHGHPFSTAAEAYLQEHGDLVIKNAVQQLAGVTGPEQSSDATMPEQSPDATGSEQPADAAAGLPV